MSRRNASGAKAGAPKAAKGVGPSARTAAANRASAAASATRSSSPPHDHGEQNSLDEFRRFRERMNAEILGENNLVINRFFALDTRTYERGALDVKTKELLGLVASLVLRCDDCVTYHLTRCAEERVTRAELFESLSVGLIVGGSIVIPHLRRAVDRWTELEALS
ncbi:MAG TPA: carboxymuconolactone decarboxylase family protein [Gemmatimonadaceae bacterium]|nr:carboxymuconolactone decarboxylase family protein [Gemmatimonadaceae bacterium]